jgi:hypothetical protein
VAHNTSVRKTVRVELTPEEKAEVLRRVHEGVHDAEFVTHLCAAHGYGRFECQLHWHSGSNGEEAFLMCEPRAE